MTQGKLKMYRRDRLFTSDRERVVCLEDSLKNVRITDETAYFNSSKPPTKDKEASPTKSPPVHRNNTIGGGRGPTGGGAGGATGGGGGSGFASHGPVKHSGSLPNDSYHKGGSSSN